MVNVEVPVGVELPVVIFNVEELVAGFGVKVPVAPVGSPLTEKVTPPVNPPEGVIVTV
jgi:hypothetical protein